MNKPTGQILVYGGGVVASATAAQLHQCGYHVSIYVPDDEQYLRHQLSFGDAIRHEKRIVEGVTAIPLPPELLAEKPEEPLKDKLRRVVRRIQKDRLLPVINQFDLAAVVDALAPAVIFRTDHPPQTDIEIDSAALVIGCFPHHTPGVHCHAAIAALHHRMLGKVLLAGDTLPAPRDDRAFFHNPYAECHTPVPGVWVALKQIGDMVAYNEPLGKVDEIEIRSPYNGQIWGLLHSGRFVSAKDRLAEIFEGREREDYLEWGFTERAVAGSVLNVLLRNDVLPDPGDH